MTKLISILFTAFVFAACGSDVVQGKYEVDFIKTADTCEEEFTEETMEDVYFSIYERGDTDWVLENQDSKKDNKGSIIATSNDGLHFVGDGGFGFFNCLITWKYIFDFEYPEDALGGTYQFNDKVECVFAEEEDHIEECESTWDVKGKLLKELD
jgi:hypothetical protein